MVVKVSVVRGVRRDVMHVRVVREGEEGRGQGAWLEGMRRGVVKGERG